MPQLEGKATMLLQVLVCNYSDLSPDFINYDTGYWTLNGVGHYQLPKNSSRAMVLLLLTGNHLWTTIREWSTDKEAKYQAMVGKAIPIEIE